MKTLTTTEKRRLTIYKWTYSLESAGFTPEQARRLIFLRWLVNMDRVTDWSCS